MKKLFLLLLFLVYSLTDNISGLPVPFERDPELNPDLFEGDILGIDPRNAVINERRLWPGGIIPYEVDPDFPLSDLEKQTLQLAVEAYRVNTCLRLIERTNEEDYVKIAKTGRGCSSFIGLVGAGSQQMSLDPECYRDGEPGTVIHEFMHAAGFYHEQSRTDRDIYVYVNYTNVAPRDVNNFYSYDNETITDLGQPYDYGSVMHYGPYQFAVDPSVPTVTPINQETGELDLSIPTGQRRGFSEIDIIKLNLLYNC